MVKTNRQRRIYGFPRNGRLESYLSPDIEVRPLRIWHLPFLKPYDVILTPRPWCILFEVLGLMGGTQRPYLVQVADGFVFEQNARKNRNRRYGHQFKRILADYFVVAQPIDSIASFVDATRVVSVRELESSVCSDRRQRNTIIFLFANDPFLNLPEALVFGALGSVINDLLGRGIRDFRYSTTSERVEQYFKRYWPSFEKLGRIKDAELDIDQCVCIATPGTAALELSHLKVPTFILSCFDDGFFSLNFNNEQWLLQRANPSGFETVGAKMISFGQRQMISQKFLDTICKEKNSRFTTTIEIFRNFSVRKTLREVSFLICIEKIQIRLRKK